MDSGFGNYPTTQINPSWRTHYGDRAITVEKTTSLGTHTLQKTLKFNRHK
jgi:hypothetical protein